MAGESPQHATIVIVCALEFERAQLVRAGLSKAFEMHVCGPGEERTAAWVKANASDDRPVILAGLAGALTQRITIGSACTITEVITNTSERLTPSLPAHFEDVISATVSCPAGALTTPDAKRIWRDVHHTDLIDLESEAFASAMSAAGRQWAIVRGVSDGPDDTLPEDIDRWVDETGRTRIGYVAWQLARSHAKRRAAKQLGLNANRAMDSVAAVLRRLTNSR